METARPAVGVRAVQHLTVLLGFCLADIIDIGVQSILDGLFFWSEVTHAVILRGERSHVGHELTAGGQEPRRVFVEL